jgi:tRNA nucleotidyltransferase/poly(A) polymerase
MTRQMISLLGVLVIPVVACAQTSPVDSQTLQAILAEIRLLRQDLQANAMTLQRSQLLLSRWQTQQGAVARSQQRLEEARAKLADTRRNQKNFPLAVRRAEDALARTNNPAEKKALESEIESYKREIETLPEEEQQRLAKESEAEEQLRNDQLKLSEIESQLDEIDKSLRKLDRPPGGSPR